MVTLLVIMSCIVTITESKVKQWLPFGGREYYIGTELVNYEEAEYNCSRLDSRTVAIYNESIEMFLRKTIQKSNIAERQAAYWIGLQGTLRSECQQKPESFSCWNDGSQVLYNNFVENETLNTNVKFENCVSMGLPNSNALSNSAYSWYTISCSGITRNERVFLPSYICQRSESETTTIEFTAIEPLSTSTVSKGVSSLASTITATTECCNGNEMLINLVITVVVPALCVAVVFFCFVGLVVYKCKRFFKQQSDLETASQNCFEDAYPTYLDPDEVKPNTKQNVKASDEKDNKYEAPLPNYTLVNKTHKKEKEQVEMNPSDEIAGYSMAGEGNSGNQHDPPLTSFQDQTYESLQSPKRNNDGSDETYDELTRNR